MKKPFTLLIFLFFSINLHSQIEISPEVGVSYVPYTRLGVLIFGGPSFYIRSKKVNALLGISAHLPIHNNWYINSRLSFTNRKKINLTAVPGPGYLHSKLRHYDLNVDFTIMRKFGNVSLGIGPNYTRKFMSEACIYEQPSSNTYISHTFPYIFGLNGRVSISIYKKIYINITYLRVADFYGAWQANYGYNRFDLTLSYKLLSNSKN